MEKELLKQVLIEATNLREAITDVERGRLDYSNLITSHIDSCIYGLISGNCFSERARELILKCCKKVLVPEQGEFERVEDCVLSKDNPTELDKKYLDREFNYYSPIEKYIMVLDANDDDDKLIQLINYLKKQTDTFIP